MMDRFNHLWINGEKVTLPETKEVFSPATGEKVGIVPNGGREVTEQAIESAFNAYKTWSVLPAGERSHYLQDWADRILKNSLELAEILSAEQGKPVRESREEIEGSCDFIYWYAEEAKRNYGELIPGSKKNQRIMVFRQPVGVAALITPWNFPAAMVTRKTAPALAAGCTVILKPASQTPMIAIALFQHLMDTGIPAGVANLVTGKSSEIGDTLLSDSRVRKISFTGSTGVGKELMRKAADQVKRISLELGGNAPVIIFPDSDMDLAADAIVANKFENCGQVCNGINLIYVHQEAADELTEKIVERVRRLKVGPPAEPDVNLGPLIDGSELRKVESLIEDAREKGAHILCGGKRLQEEKYQNGHYYAPTVLNQVNQEMRLVHEEIFGPVAPILTFESEEEVISRCNNTPYGLAAYVFTKDVARVYRMSESLETGMVAVNSTSLSVPQAPFGGIKESGMGREGGHYGLEEFLNIKYVSLNLGE